MTCTTTDTDCALFTKRYFRELQQHSWCESELYRTQQTHAQAKKHIARRAKSTTIFTTTSAQKKLSSLATSIELWSYNLPLGGHCHNKHAAYPPRAIHRTAHQAQRRRDSAVMQKRLCLIKITSAQTGISTM